MESTKITSGNNENDNLKMRGVKEFIIIHLVFVACCVGILLITPLALGLRMFILVCLYNALIPITGKFKGYKPWLTLWFFVLIVSVWQVWPDWFLAEQLDVLAFPDDGFLKIGEVSLYMAGLWAIPLFLVVFIGLRIKEKKSTKVAYLSVILLSLLIFVGSEATIWALPSWSAKNVTTIGGHVALYIIFPEIILGLSTFYLYIKLEGESTWKRIFASFIVMLLYMGSISFFHFLIEGIIFG